MYQCVCVSKLPMLNQHQISTLSRLITLSKIGKILKRLPTKKNQVSDQFSKRILPDLQRNNINTKEIISQNRLLFVVFDTTLGL